MNLQTIPGGCIPAALFITSSGALAAYALAEQSRAPSDYREAARQLAKALRVEMGRTSAQSAPTVVKPAKATPRKVKASDAVDMDAPLANVPKTQRGVGDFIVTWADGSQTLVRGVIYHGKKPESA